MKANELQINNFLQAPNVQFVIPVYQRNYDWTNTECKELLNDIISVETEDRGTHFIGSIVFVHEGTYIDFQKLIFQNPSKIVTKRL
jgi:uncharacterized protein with ParB-like and HNH nuclease domain